MSGEAGYNQPDIRREGSRGGFLLVGKAMQGCVLSDGNCYNDG